MYGEFKDILREEKRQSQHQRDLLSRFMRTQNTAIQAWEKHYEASGRPKKLWLQPELEKESNAYWETVVPLLSNTRFVKKFRLGRKAFQILVDELHDKLFKNDTKFRKAIPVPKRIAIALYYLKSNQTAQEVANTFGVGESTVNSLLHEFCDAVNDKMLQKYVVFPESLDEKKAIAEDFMTRWQFPNTYGSLDGTHIPIISPEEFPDDYWNYKSYHSIILMALVDAKGKFIYANIGRPGKANDASIFNECSLKKILIETTELDESLHIIGDGAFPLMTSVMKPYLISDKNTQQQVNFNRRLSRARVVVEDAFGRLKGRFRILMKRADFKVETINKIVKTCIVLHNICEDHSERYWPDWNHEVATFNKLYEQPQYTSGANFDWSTAKGKRDALCQMLFDDKYHYPDN